jgi:hypothetical protein
MRKRTSALIGTLDTADEPFYVGYAATYVCPVAGRLSLGVNDNDPQGNRGEFRDWITHRQKGRRWAAGIDEAVLSGRIGILGIARARWMRRSVPYLRREDTRLFEVAPVPSQEHDEQRNNIPSQEYDRGPTDVVPPREHEEEEPDDTPASGREDEQAGDVPITMTPSRTPVEPRWTARRK